VIPCSLLDRYPTEDAMIADSLWSRYLNQPSYSVVQVTLNFGHLTGLGFFAYHVGQMTNTMSTFCPQDSQVPYCIIEVSGLHTRGSSPS
jgi:hypothetical protein